MPFEAPAIETVFFAMINCRLACKQSFTTIKISPAVSVSTAVYMLDNFCRGGWHRLPPGLQRRRLSLRDESGK